MNSFILLFNDEPFDNGGFEINLLSKWQMMYPNAGYGMKAQNAQLETASD